MPVHYALRQDVAVLSLDNGAVNALSLPLRQEFASCVQRAITDKAVRAIVITGSGRMFCGGADIGEFDSPKARQVPNLLTMIHMLDNCPKPAVAAINGQALGGGLELTMGCHYRVAAPNAKCGLPEVKIGLIPGGEGTQRLPRLAGLETALNMIVSGDPQPVEALAKAGLIDKVIDGDLIEGAAAFAREMAAKGGSLPRARDRKLKDPNAEGYLRFAENTVASVVKNFPAPLGAVEAVKAAASLPFEDGCKKELEIFARLMMTPESRSLRHAFFAERAAAKIKDVPDDIPARPLKAISVVGAGTMGGGISMNFLNAGIPVTILESSQEALDRGLARIRANYETSAKRGRMTMDDVAKRMALLKPTLNYADIAGSDLVIEAVFEDMGVKKAVFEKLDQVVKQGAILASNTSTLDVDKIASFTKRPKDVLGLHFFSPANVMKLLEIVRGKETSKDALATAMTLAKVIKKTAVVAGNCDGFIGNRMLGPYFTQAYALVDEGASPQEVDKALEAWGMAMGPFRMTDMAGNDISLHIRKRHYAEHPNMKREIVADRIAEAGRFGQKTGAGWYRYEPGGRNAIPDPVVAGIIETHRKEAGITPRKIPASEIVERCIYALVNEGAHIVEEGFAQRASDLDVVYLTGYGFPLHRGGPMRYANETGLYNVAGAMRRFAARGGSDADFWKPAALIEKAIAEGRDLA